MEKFNKLLSEELIRQIEELPKFETGSIEMDNAVEDVVKLHNLLNDNTKAMSEMKRLDYDREIHENNLAEMKKDRYAKIGIAAAEIFIPLVFYGVWMVKGLKFEETGSFTSQTFKGLFSKFRPTK